MQYHHIHTKRQTQVNLLAVHTISKDVSSNVMKKMRVLAGAHDKTHRAARTVQGTPKTM
jgi:hypothetical protein